MLWMKWYNSGTINISCVLLDVSSFHYITKLDDSAFLRTQSYITEICYFEFLWSFEFWLALHWDFFFKRSTYLSQYTYKVDQNKKLGQV